jgi:protocatechuate 3,4-dioxygenase beta subunit
MHAGKTVFLCLILIAGLAGHSIARETETITCTGKVVDAQGRPVAGAKVGLYTLILYMDTFSFDVELSQQTTTKDDGNFNFETMAESNDANIQTVILADKEGLALGWANWYLTKDLDVQITLGRPTVLAGRVVDESSEPVNNAQVSISVMTMTGGDEPRYIAGRISEQLFSCKTNAAGKFQFERIPPDATAEFIAAKDGLATVGTLDESNPQETQPQFNAGRKDIEFNYPSKRKSREWLWKRIPANRFRV